MNYKDIIARNFSRAARTYDEYAIFQNGLAQKLKAQILEEAEAADAILDAGTGTGTLAIELAKPLPKSSIYGCDIAGEMLRVAKEKIASSKVSNFNCMQADVEHLPYRNSSFNIVVSNMALHWACDIEGALAELARVLANGGWLFVSVAAQEMLFELHRSTALAAAKSGINISNDLPRFPSNEVIVEHLRDLNICEITTTQVEEKLYYKSPRELLLSLKRTGTNRFAKTDGAPLPASLLSRAMEIYEKEYGNGNGICATFKALLIRARK